MEAHYVPTNHKEFVLHVWDSHSVQNILWVIVAMNGISVSTLCHRLVIGLMAKELSACEGIRSKPTWSSNDLNSADTGCIGSMPANYFTGALIKWNDKWNVCWVKGEAKISLETRGLEHVNARGVHLFWVNKEGIPLWSKCRSICFSDTVLQK